VNQFQANGATGDKQTRGGVIFTNRFFNGLWTNRNQMRAPTGVIYETYYHLGSNDTLIDGENTELSNRLTIIRRPGCPQFSPVVLPASPDVFSSFHELNGTIKVLADTAANVYIMGLQSSITTAQITSNVATYTTSAAHGYTVGQLVTVVGCTSSFFNVTSIAITAVTTNTFSIALTNANFGPETETGAQAGTLQSIMTKSTGAGQSYFQGVGQTLYIVDGVEQRKWQDNGLGVLGNNNGNTTNPTWLMGIVAPTVAPTVTPLSSGAGNTTWSSDVFFSTMGLIIDSNGNIEQLTSINADPTNPNTTNIGTSGNGQPTWNNVPGGSTPETASAVVWTCSASPITLWAAKTNFVQYDVIYDPKTNAVYYSGNSASGLSGSTYPNFQVGPGAVHTTDGAILWRWLGLPNLWQSSHAYGPNPFFTTSDGSKTNNQYVVEPIQPTSAAIAAGQNIYIQFLATAGTSGTYTNPTWPTAIPGQVGNTIADGQLAWTFLGSATWSSLTFYSGWSVTQNTFGVVVDSVGNFQVALTTGLSGGTEPFPYWQASHTYAANFEIVDPNGHLQKVTAGGGGNSGSSLPAFSTSGGTTTDGAITWTDQGVSTTPAWGQNYGDQTLDGIIQWVNVGPSANSRWIAAKNYYLPSSGFFPPLAAANYGSAAIKDSNGNIEFVVSSGFSGSSHPSWATAKGTKTTDNTGGGTDVGVVWINNGLPSTISFIYETGYGYAYAFKARTATDLYTIGSAPSTITSPPGVTSLDGTSPRTLLPVATGSGSGAVSTLSPPTTFLGTNQAGAVIKISGLGSIDPQVDTVEIYRTDDGGDTYFYLTDIPNPSLSQNGSAGTWTLFDATPDLGLNPLILGDPANVGVNTPPPLGLVNLIYFAGRLWGSVGASVFASAGPDVGNPDEPAGNGFESWPPANNFPFSSNVVRLVPINQGILVFTTSDLHIIGGGPSIESYTSALLVPGYGLLSWNALAQNGGQIFFYSADKRLLSFDPAGSISELGYPIGDQLAATFDPTKAYMTWHVHGSNDQALFIADGSSEWFRANISLSPDQSITGGICWSPRAPINSGSFKAINSVETQPGVRQLLIGQAGSGVVLYRDSTFSTFTDNGSPYESYATIGSIVVANPGQMAELDFITAEFMQVGTSPKLLVLLDELTGTFEDLSGYVSATTGIPPQDPPLNYGLTLTPNTIFANRYYFAQSIAGATPQPTSARFLSVKIDFGSTDTSQNELLTMTLFGRHFQES